MNEEAAHDGNRPLAGGSSEGAQGRTYRLTGRVKATSASLSGRTSVIWLGRVGLLIGFLGLWEFAVNQELIKEFFVSKPTEIAAFMQEAISSGELWEHLVSTLQATVVGFVTGSLAGIVMGLIFARFPTLNKIVDPYLTMLNSLPRVALAPLFLLWFGIGILSKVMLAISLVFFILIINTRSGIQNVDEDLVTMSRVMGARELDHFWKVMLPAATPAIFSGLRLAVIYSLLGVVVGEMIAAEAGLGQRLTFYSGTFRIAGVMGVLLVLGLIATLLNVAMALAERRLLGWKSSA